MRSGLSRLWPWSGYAGRRRDAAAILQVIASSYYDTQVGGSATALFRLGSNGLAAGGPGVLSGTAAYAWLSGDVASLYQVVVTLDGTDSFSSGAAGTFSLDTTREWQVTRSSTGTKSATANFSIELISDPGVSLADADITLTATIDAGSGGGGSPPDPENPFGGGDIAN